MERAAWLEERRKGVGGSDIAPIMGISPWKTAYQVYLEKIGEVRDYQESEVMDWGKRMEPALRQWYSDKTGRSVRLPDKILYHKEYPFMLASLDGYTDDQRVVELKTSRYGKDWSEEIPDYYQVQVQHYLFVTGFPVADTVVSIGGGSPELYEIPEDKELQQMILEAATEFWQRVQDRNPPPITTYADAVRRYGKSMAQGLVFASDAEITLVNDLRAVREDTKVLEAKEEAIKAILIKVLGDQADTLVNPDGTPLITYKMAKGRISLDAKALEREHPDIYKKHLKASEPVRRFLIK